MIIPDANLLLFAYNLKSPFHARAAAWWEQCLSGTEPVGLTPPTILAFVRIATNPRVFAEPMTLAETEGHIADWTGQPVAKLLAQPSDHVADVVSLLREAGGTAGNLVSDAQIAAFALVYRGVVHTADRDFLRFRSVRCHFPLDT